jgi:hypothetical protein
MAESGRKRFNKFHERVSQEAGCDTKAGERLPFAPDFLDNLIRRIATGDLAEAVMDWTIYRASGNQQKYAIHLYGHNGDTPVETALRQTDCALELAWLAASHPPEWLDAPLELFQGEAARRGVAPIDKSLISEAFTFNRRRGTIARDTGYFITLVPSPKVGDSTEHLRRKGESPDYREFLAQWKVAHSAETEEELVARSIIDRINKVRLSAYKDWKRSRAPQRNGGPSLETLEPSETLEAPPSPAPAPVAVSSSSKPTELKKEKTSSLPRNDDDEKPKPEYASARDEVKAIYHAKTGAYPTVQLLDRIEGIITGKGETWDSYLAILKPHLGGNWDNPGGFLTWLAKTGFEPVASPPQEKPKPKCPRCHSDNQRGAILLNDEIVPCPDCSTSAEWREELAAKMKRPPVSKGASGDD